MATGLTVLGVGAADTAVANFDASSWLWSTTRGEVDRVNGVTARVDTRTKIKDAQNHEIQVTQTDKYLVLRDLNTGQVSALDLTTLQISAVMPTTPGLGVSVALAGETAFVIDSVQGQVRQLDPRSLAPIGDSITLPHGIVSGGFDGKGTLWVGVPTEGTVVAISPGVGGASPKVVRTITVADPATISCCPLRRWRGRARQHRQGDRRAGRDRPRSTAVPIDKPGSLPAAHHRQRHPDHGRRGPPRRGRGRQDDPHLHRPGHRPAPAGGRLRRPRLRADPVAGIVYEFDGTGKLLTQIKIHSAGGPLELEVRENHLFINAPNGSTARVVDEKHVVKEVNKYAKGVLGADPPPRRRRTRTRRHRSRCPAGRRTSAPPPATSPRPSPGARPPTTARPSPSTSSRAPASPSRSAANQRSVDITGLTNAQT